MLLFEENARGISAGSGYAHNRRLRGYAKWLERSLNDAVSGQRGAAG